MTRLLPTRRIATRRSPTLQTTLPSAAGAVLFAAGLALAAAPVAAQQIGTTAPPSPGDPWHGIIMVTPAGEASPYDAAQQAADAAASDAAHPAETAQPVIEPFDPETDTAEVPSLWTTLELGIGGSPEPEPEVPAANQLVLQRKSVPAAKRTPLPTRVEVRQGAASLSVSSSASAVAPVSGLLSRTDSSGSGEIKGRVGVEQDSLTVYSAGTLGASASAGTTSLYDNLAVGSTYSVPLAPIGLGKEKLGASVEVNNSQTVTTGIELRAPEGSYERFISVQRSASPDSDPSGIVKAGVLGKF